MTLFTISLVPILMIGCGDKDTGFPQEDYIEGDNPGDCTDDFDNDFDGLVDCDDDGCSDVEVCIDEADLYQDVDGFTPY